MSSINVTNIKHPSSASNNIVLDSAGRALIGVSSANANGGILQLSSGITFPATQVLSTDPNTLDDYEEGTWTPSVGGNATYTAQIGRYRKVGQLVYIQCYLIINTIGTGSTTIVSGLPFTALNATSVTHAMPVSYFSSLATNSLYLIGVVLNNTATLNFSHNNTSGATFTNFAVAVFGNSTRIDFSGCYIADT